MTFERYRPQVLIVENFLNERAYRQVMRKRGYALWRRLAPNDVYVLPSLLSLGEHAVARVRSAYWGLRRTDWPAH